MMYRGYDLTNQDSMKVAVDVLVDVVKNNIYYKQADVHARYEVASLDELDAKIGGYKSRISDLTKQLGIAQAEVKNKEEIIGRLQDNYKALEDDKNILMDRLEQSQNTITQLGRDKGNLAIEVEQLRIQVETLKQGNQQGGITADSTLKQFVEWVKNLFWKN
jgi:chromosome segregation ATPase